VGGPYGARDASPPGQPAGTVPYNASRRRLAAKATPHAPAPWLLFPLAFLRCEVIVRRVLLFAAPLLVAGCVGSHPWAPTKPTPQTGPRVPADARSIYHAMGLLSDTAGLRCIASIHYLATNSPDSNLAVLGVSIANRALHFVPEGKGFAASYSVELSYRSRGTTARDVERDETVRVGSARETLRSDESILFQEIVTVPPGTFAVDAVVRDRNNPVVADLEVADSVLRFTGPRLAAPIAIYEGTGRTSLSAVPTLVVNPRSTLRLGKDSLRFYVEGYGLRPGTRIAAHISDMDSVELWRDTLTTTGDSTLAQTMIVIPPGTLPLGRAQLVLDAVAESAHVTAPLLVSFSDRWATTKFDQMLTLLQFFPRQDLVAALRGAAKDARARAWHDFYHASDPDPTTPQNEALDRYFQRLDEANERYGEPTMSGWRTDRGQVFIALGAPDREFDVAGAVPGLRWEFDHPRLTLYFKDIGFGQFRLTPESKADFDRVTAGTRTPAP
jgi:GWxTD domain-containing protein